MSAKKTIYQVDDKNVYCLKYTGKTRLYYNDGSKEGDTYYFYRDVGRGYKELYKFTRDLRHWSIYKYLNEIRYAYTKDDSWNLQTSLIADPII